MAKAYTIFLMLLLSFSLSGTVACEAAKIDMSQLDYILVTCDYIKATNGMGTIYNSVGQVDPIMVKILKKYGYGYSAYPKCEENMGLIGPQDMFQAKMELALQCPFPPNSCNPDCKGFKNRYANLAGSKCGARNNGNPQCQSLEWNLEGDNKNEKWLTISVNNIKKIGNTDWTVDLTVSNNKAIFFVINSSGAGLGDLKTFQKIDNNILFPKQEKTFNDVSLKLDCNNNSRIEINANRGYIYSQDSGNLSFSTPLGMFLSWPVLTNSISTLRFTNKAAYLNSWNLVWTGLTGEWWSEDFGNAVSALNAVLGYFPEASEALAIFGGNFAPDALDIAYKKGIDPVTALKSVITALSLIANGLADNPTIRTEAWPIFEKLLPAFAREGPKVLATNLSIIVTNGFKVLALAPISWDILSTREIGNQTAITISCMCQ